MLVAGLLTSDQLAAIFLNADELIQVNARFCEVLRDAVEMAYDSGDEDLARVHVGKLFLDSLSMLRAFESYCTRQVSTKKKDTSNVCFLNVVKSTMFFKLRCQQRCEYFFILQL